MDQEKREKDYELVRQAQNGQEKAFGELYQLYMKPLYRFVYSKVGNQEVAEDLTQTTFLKMLESLSSFSFGSSFKTWLYRIALNTVMDHWRSVYKGRTLPLEDFIGILKANSEEIDQEEQQKKEKLVHEVIMELSPREQRILELRFLQGYSIKEVAQELELSLSNVKVIQHRAIRKARELRNPYSTKLSEGSV